jgi:hypothetical protein
LLADLIVMDFPVVESADEVPETIETDVTSMLPQP